MTINSTGLVTNFLERNGCNRERRGISALSPSYIKVDERKIEDLLRLAWQYAGELNYFSSGNRIDGNFQDFLVADPAISFAVIATSPDYERDRRFADYLHQLKGPKDDCAVIQNRAMKLMKKSLEEKGNHKAHAGLLLSFLYLFKENIDQMNKITQRHLNYYFRSLLKFDNLKPKPDSVHVLIGLFHKKPFHIIKKGTGFKAGKDALGKELIYRLKEDFTATRAIVASQKNIYLEKQDKDKLTVYAGDIENPAEARPLFGCQGLPLAVLGFAVTTPVLRLNEGKRQITFIFDLKFTNKNQLDNFIKQCKKGESADKKWLILHDIFYLEFTGPEGWIKIRTADVALDPGPIHRRGIITRNRVRLKISIFLPAENPAVTDYHAGIHKRDMESLWPIFRFILNQSAYPALYRLMRDIEIIYCEIDVNVKGMKNILIENEAGPLDPSKPFIPFGPRPAEGSAFYIGSREIFQKKLDSLKISWTWPDAPENFKKYFKSYQQFSEIKIKPEILHNGKWVKVKEDAFVLEGKETDTFNLTDIKLSENGEKHDFYPDLEEFTAFNINMTTGFIKFEICNRGATFGHREYPALLAKAMNTKDMRKKIDLINEPYTPVFHSLEVDYKSSLNINFVKDGPIDGSHFGFFRLYPFGHEKVGRKDLPHYLLPKYRKEAYLYIGIGDLNPPQVLSLLFHLEDNKGKYTEQGPGQISWACLSDNRWHDFGNTEILHDSTRNLAKTGIIKFSVPETACRGNTILPSDLHWLRASITSGSKAVNRVLNISAQAVCLVFSDHENDPARLPLPAGSIKKLEINDPGIGSVIQPCESFGGRGKETDALFSIRVSERLRHKDRAVSAWDYERLVLQKFPEIYMVKCLNHTGADLQLSPGKVTLVVIPKIDKTNSDILKPYIGRVLLRQIKEFLRSRISPFIEPAVVNPCFEEIQIIANVCFTAKYDLITGKRELSKSLTGFFTPWAYRPDEISFTKSFSKQEVVEFIDAQECVKKVISLYAVHNNEKHTLILESQPAFQNFEEIRGNTPASILMSSEYHIIKGPEEILILNKELDHG